jgi:ABC-type nitrate/sulfonate/bicarbonate transport system substrate-binding protein
MPKRVKPFKLILILVIVFLSFAIVNNSRAQEKIVVAYSGVSGFQGPLWTFNDLKLANKYGLDPETVMIVGGQRSIQGLLSGHIHFNLSSATAPMGARRHGADLVIVAAGLNKFPFSFVTQTEIREPAQLAGKKIGISNFGGSNDLAVNMALKEWGLSRQSVTLLRTGDAASRFLALSNKAIDATLLSPPSTTDAKSMGFNILAHMGDMRSAFPQTVVSVNRAFLQKRRDVVKQFLKGYSEAIYTLMQSREIGIRVYKKNLRQQDVKVLEDTYDDIAGKFSFPPRVNREGIRSAWDFVALEFPGTKSDLNPEQMIDESVIDELEKEGFFKSLRNK